MALRPFPYAFCVCLCPLTSGWSASAFFFSGAPALTQSLFMTGDSNPDCPCFNSPTQKKVLCSLLSVWETHTIIFFLSFNLHPLHHTDNHHTNFFLFLQTLPLCSLLLPFNLPSSFNTSLSSISLKAVFKWTKSQRKKLLFRILFTWKSPPSFLSLSSDSPDKQDDKRNPLQSASLSVNLPFKRH
jgi:hypothetical protein